MTDTEILYLVVAIGGSDGPQVVPESQLLAVLRTLKEGSAIIGRMPRAL